MTRLEHACTNIFETDGFWTLEFMILKCWNFEEFQFLICSLCNLYFLNFGSYKTFVDILYKAGPEHMKINLFVFRKPWIWDQYPDILTCFFGNIWHL